MAAVVTQVNVSSAPDVPRQKGEHWANKDGTLFVNPWPSFKKVNGPTNLVKMFYEVGFNPPPDKAEAYKNPSKFVPQVKPDFNAPHPSTKMKATWLGHACFLVELPSETGGRGVTILFDPVFSKRCSPSQWAGPERFTPAPCDVAALPEVDVIIISHNHYDHEDITTLSQLYTKHSSRPPALFIPLNTARTLGGVSNLPKTSVTEFDWWESREIDVPGKGKAKITCTPSQHFTNRMPWDQNYSLWASWAIHSLPKESKPVSVWFGGDTGYCTVDTETYDIDPSLPVCPAFKEIGDRLGPFTLGLIPIGAYKPRWFMSSIHNCPTDAVRMFKDTKCKKALGIHWGTWILTNEPIAEPPKKLAEARKLVGLADDDFTTCAIGETTLYDP